jgi:hypothetical protein
VILYWYSELLKCFIQASVYKNKLIGQNEENRKLLSLYIKNFLFNYIENYFDSRFETEMDNKKGGVPQKAFFLIRYIL